MNRILNEELNKMKFLFGYEKGRVISEQTQTTTQLTPKDLIVKIQTVLKEKYKQNLGPKGADGVWGNYTQTAFENVMKTFKPNTSTGASTAASTGTTTSASTGTTTAASTGTTTAASTGTTPNETQLKKQDLNPLFAKLASANAEQYYNDLVQKGLIDSVATGKNRIVYRGPKDDNVEKYVNQYLNTLGYQQTRERSPIERNKQVTVWKK